MEPDPPGMAGRRLSAPCAGVPKEGNLRGISFAAANVSGILARALEDEAIREWICPSPGR